MKANYSWTDPETGEAMPIGLFEGPDEAAIFDLIREYLLKEWHWELEDVEAQKDNIQIVPE